MFPAITHGDSTIDGLDYFRYRHSLSHACGVGCIPDTTARLVFGGAKIK